MPRADPLKEYNRKRDFKLTAEPAGKRTAPARDQPRVGTALMIVDLLNRFDFSGGNALRREATRTLPAARTGTLARRSG